VEGKATLDTSSWPINPGDAAILVILLISALLAFARGFVREVLSIVGWVGAALIAVWAFPQVSPIARTYITNELIADVAAGVGVFVVALIVLSAIAHLLARTVRGSAMNAVDRSLGFLFGIFRGAVIVCLGWLLLEFLLPEADQRPPWIGQARALPLVERGAAMIKSLVPEDLVAQGTATAREIDPDAAAAEALRQLSQPQPNRDAPPGEPGYNDPSRGQLEQLIENAR
jgi:membrane protein required for colicin V production